MTSPDTLKRLEWAAMRCVNRKTGFAFRYDRTNEHLVINQAAFRALEKAVADHRSAYAKRKERKAR